MQILKFEPLLKQTLWGGNKILPFKNINSNLQNVGESWEISGVKDNETVVSEGTMKGLKLNEVVAEMREKLMGRENYERFGDEFPLLIKFIDARQDLSIQVHPNDETARRQGKKRGKTEMWYFMSSEPEAKIFCGLKEKISPDKYREMVETDTICDALAQYNVGEDNVFFLPSGRIHAIRSGCFLAEIQQTSDVTYRIYDFKRKDKDGNFRQLHTKEAAESIDYTVEDDYHTHYEAQKNIGVPLVSCQYFCTSVYDLDEPMILDYSELDSFVILIALKGEGQIIEEDGTLVSFRAGETVLIPATTQILKVEGTIKFLETY
ncbi:MAG: type I phosphomannose isomerase catalytic subunit [Prevotella sp.]|uniref:type I phosphomannose isomerase catalytic subunit n=1 Tax=Prevotella sp. TaxID=59823 RepID=UPI002A332C05|nr:type I phosphomannose isomerase catalytic subunit [Prevotella sp.]MDD7318874.1 mannose-6-phosphate isomerase [Prevotellaceae bacterium]MDY4019253.1 type I phosphomannose isomerase catalytic subunit [Prevotella sp.]